MSNKTQVAQAYKVINTFEGDQFIFARAAYPVGGTEFVYFDVSGAEVTVPSSDYDIWAKYPVQISGISQDTDCDEVHLWI